MSNLLSVVHHVARVSAITLAGAALSPTIACKPKMGSDLKGIVGIAEDGKMRAFGLLPMHNMPSVNLQDSSNENLQHAINLATKTEYYGLVECTAHHTGNAEDWMQVVEERAANGDLGILPNRRLIVTGDRIDAFDGTLPCRVVGRFLATMPELDEVLGSIIDNPEGVDARQFRLAQTVYLSLRGPTSTDDESAVSSLMQRYVDNAVAHFGAKNLSASEMKSNLLALDSIFNPCSTESPALDLPAEARGWRNQNYACVPTTRQGGTEKVYRPGGESGSLYVDVRNLVAAELAYVHLKVLKGAKKIDKDLHRLINLLTSTADWTNIRKDSEFKPLASYLSSSEGTSFDFNGIYSQIKRQSYSGIALTADADDLEEAEFELYGSTDDEAAPSFALGGCSAATKQQATGRQATCGQQQQGAKGKTGARGPTATPSALIDPQGPGYIAAMNRNLALFLGANATNVAPDINARYIAAQTKADNATLSKGLASKYQGYSNSLGRLSSTAPTSAAELARQVEVQRAFSGLKSGSRSVTANNKNYEYLGEQGTGNSAYIGLRDTTTGAYHFADKSGNIQSWEPLKANATGRGANNDFQTAQNAFKATNGASPSIYQQAGTNRFQAVTKVGNETRETLGIKDGSDQIVAYPTKKEDKSISIDWKDESAQKNIVKQLSDTVEQERNAFKTAYAAKNPGLPDDTMNKLFKMSNTGLLTSDNDTFKKNAQTAGLSEADMKALGYQPAANGTYTGDGAQLNQFVTQKTQDYDQRLNAEIGQMLTVSDQQTLGIDPATGNPDQAIYNAVTDQGTAGAGGVTLANNTRDLSQDDQAVFASFTPAPANTTTTPPAATGTAPTPPANTTTTPPANTTTPPASDTTTPSSDVQ